MFDVGWPELVVILIVAVLVIGPRDLPKALYTMGKWLRAARRVTADFQRHVDDMMREAELDDLRKVANQAKSLNVKKQIEETIDPTGELRNPFDVNEPKGKAGNGTSTEAAKPGIPTGSTGSGGAEATAKPAAKEVTGAGTAPKKAARKVPQRPSRTGGAARKSAAKAPAPEKAP